jgi:hypothetical protein
MAVCHASSGLYLRSEGIPTAVGSASMNVPTWDGCPLTHVEASQQLLVGAVLAPGICTVASVLPVPGLASEFHFETFTARSAERCGRRAPQRTCCWSCWYRRCLPWPIGHSHHQSATVQQFAGKNPISCQGRLSSDQAVPQLCLLGASLVASRG